MPSSRYYKFKEVSREERIKKLKFLFLSVSICGLFLGIIWVIFFSPIFKIKNIQIISDNTYVNGNDIIKIVSDIAPLGFRENLIIVSNSRLQSELAAIFPAITDISVKKKLFNTLTVNFKKRIPVGIWCGSLDCYYFDKEGIAFLSAPKTEGGLILKIKDVSKNSISLGGKVLDTGQVHFILTFIENVGKINKFKVLEFQIKPNSLVDFEAVTDTGWLIYLDDTQDPKAAVNNLLTILDEAVKNTRNLEYIDLRIPNRVFYKLR